MIISLYSSRLFLQALGVEDYGIYNAVGGFVSLFWMVSSALSSAISRFLNVELGKKDQAALNEVFSIALNLMAIMAIVVVILTESFGMWFLTSKMTIPPERMRAAIIVFHISVFHIITGFTCNPFDSSITAHERMGIYAFVNIAEVLLKLVVALFLVYGNVTADKLVLYAIALATITACSRTFIVLYCRTNFPECRFRPILFTNKLKEIFNYAVWNLIGSVSNAFSGQGVNMSLNITHGPVLNSARGLADTIQSTVSMLVYNFTLALTPQITQSYAAGNARRTRSLVFSGTKFASYLVLLIIIPFILETDFVLNLWLVEVPAYTVYFVQLSLLYVFLYTVNYLFETSKMAVGNIRNYQIILSILSFLNFPLSIVFLKKGLSPVWIYIVPLITSIIKVSVSIHSVRKQLSYGRKDIIIQVLLPIVLVACIAAIPPSVLHFKMQYGWLRFVLVLFTSIACTSATALFLGCTQNERSQLLSVTKQFTGKLFHK